MDFSFDSKQLRVQVKIPFYFQTFLFRLFLIAIRNYKRDSRWHFEAEKALRLFCTICEKSCFIVMRFFTDERTCFCLLCALCKSLSSLFSCAFASGFAFAFALTRFASSEVCFHVKTFCVLSRFIQQILI